MSSQPRDIAVLIPAAGRGRRFGAEENKLFATLDGVPIWQRTIERFVGRPEVVRIVMAVDGVDQARFERAIESAGGNIELVCGGAERMDSVRSALNAIMGDPLIRSIAIHDAARPLVTDDEIDAVFRAARVSGAAFLGVPVTGSLHRRIGRSTQSVDRRELFQAATPQVFEARLFETAYQKHNGRPATDDVQLVQRMGHPVEIVEGRTDNLKITYPEDLAVAESILRGRAAQAR